MVVRRTRVQANKSHKSRFSTKSSRNIQKTSSLKGLFEFDHWIGYAFESNKEYNSLGDKKTEIVIPGDGSMELKEFLEQNLGYDYDFLPEVAVAHIGWVLLFAFVFAFGIKFLNFQKR
jgi:hypothetical protein